MALKTVACPQCRKPTPWDGNPHRPFCSDRCRTIDLGQWAEEEYKIPVKGEADVIPFPVAEDEKE